MRDKKIRESIELRNGSVINQLIVIGRLHNSNKRFKMTYEATPEGWRTAMSINLWKGSVWGVGAYTGKRHLIKRVNN
jgi:hypothetical protein